MFICSENQTDFQSINHEQVKMINNGNQKKERKIQRKLLQNTNFTMSSYVNTYFSYFFYNHTSVAVGILYCKILIKYRVIHK